MNERRTLIVAGVGPVPVGNPGRVYAPGLRLYAFSKILHESGFRVIMGEAAFAGKQEALPTAGAGVPWEHRVLPFDVRSAAPILRQWIHSDRPEAVITTTDVMNLASAMAGEGVPRWMDFNGHPMVERQELSRVHSCDDGLADQWNQVLPSLLAGDHFSTCSTPQKYALIGELGAVGRLNRFTSGHDLVTSIPPGPVFHEGKPTGIPALRGRLYPENAFCLLWNGGFNTWVDEEMLFKGVEAAMIREERLHFLLTGGAIEGHDESTFVRFQERVNGSPVRSRFHFCGWVPLEHLPDYYAAADAAINLDRFSYEALLGCRNRLFSWIRFGLPVITTPESEITGLLVERGLAAAVRTGDSAGLAALLADMVQNPAEYKEMAVKAARFLAEEYTYERLLQPLVAWARDPRTAPDRFGVNAANLAGGITGPDNTLACLMARLRAADDMVREEREKVLRAESELMQIRGSRAWKLASLLRRPGGKK